MNRGYIKLWRKSLDNGWIKNHKVWVFWSWCLLKASHKEFDAVVGRQTIHLMPGQFIFGLRVAAEESGLTVQEIRTALAFLKSSQNLTIITTNKFSVITIVNWLTYQGDDQQNNTQDNKQLTNKSTNKSTNKKTHVSNGNDKQNYQPPTTKQQTKQQASQQHTRNNIIIDNIITPDAFKNESSVLSSQISSLEEKYSNQEIISEIFKAIASTRKTNKISDSKKLKILQSWEKYSEETVMAGIRIFLSREYHKEGKREAYLLAIIRNQEPKPKYSDTGGSDHGKTMPSTGSVLMDDHYRKQGFTITP